MEKNKCLCGTIGCNLTRRYLRTLSPSEVRNISNIRTTQSVPHHALEFVNSLLTSSFNIGISLGAFLGGVISAYYGVHYVLWVSILLLAVTFAMSFVSFPKENTESEDYWKDKDPAKIFET